MSTIADQVIEKIQSAVTANEAGDYAGALTYLRSARMLMAGRPVSMQKGTAVVTYSVTDIDAMITDIKAAKGANAGIQTIPIRFVGEER